MFRDLVIEFINFNDLFLLYVYWYFDYMYICVRVLDLLNWSYTTDSCELPCGP